MEKIINIKSNKNIEILKAKVELQDCLCMDFEKSTNSLDGNLLSYLKQFNSVIWDVKCNLIFPNINNIEDAEERRKYIEDSMEHHFSKLLAERDIKYTPVDIDYINLDEMDNKSCDIAEQLSCFNHMPIPAKTKSFLQDYVNLMEEAEAPSINDINIRKAYIQYSEPVREVEEYVMYIGDNAKYRGLVGVITEYREDNSTDKAPNKIIFIENSEGVRVPNYWAKDDNIITFCI